MIHAVYTQFRNEDGKLVLRLCAEGHAGAATEGGDIVCAAVSALMQTLGNRAEVTALNGGAELCQKIYFKAENCFEVVTRATEQEEHFGETEEEETE